MSPKPVAAWTVADYERAAREYLESLPPEHFMEATPHAAQRKITIESLDLLAARRPDVHLCNELLVQCPINSHLVQVCPDNMVVQSDEPLEAMGSFNLPFEPGHILWVLEYVSPSNKRKDYEDNYRKYQDDLKVPYYFIFDPEVHDLRLYRHNGIGYEPVAPAASGRLPVPELEVEVALLDGWARFWHRGELLPLPADLQAQVDQMTRRIKKAEAEARKERRRAEEQKRRAEEQKKRAESAKGREKLQKERAAQEKRRADQAEDEVKRLRALLDQHKAGGA